MKHCDSDLKKKIMYLHTVINNANFETSSTIYLQDLLKFSPHKLLLSKLKKELSKIRLDLKEIKMSIFFLIRFYCYNNGLNQVVFQKKRG